MVGHARSHARWLTFALGVSLSLVRQVHAQVDATEPADAVEAATLRPPRLISIEPPIVSRAHEKLNVVIEVGTDGTAYLVECKYDDATCVEVFRVLQAAVIEPAAAHGQPVRARVPLALSTHVPPAATRLTRPPANPTKEPERAPTLEFRARGEVEKQQGERRFELRELRDVPGAFGDPFRAITALPGVVTVLSGVPYVYVRGAPPAGNAYYYDDIPVPSLFHLALGPAIVHPRTVGDVKMFPAAAPARYGRLTGAVVRGLGPDKPGDETVGEVDLRLIDVNAFVATRVGDAVVQVAGRYGYPGLLLSAFSPEASLAYWDYQARAWYPVDDANDISFVWFGSFDSVGEIKGEKETNFATIEFHRGELRHEYHEDDLRLLTGLMFGFERSSIDDNEVSVNAFRLRPRFVATNQFTDQLALEAGVDLELTVGEISGRDPTRGDTDSDSLGITGAYLAAADWRIASGLYGALRLDLGATHLEVGVRADLWATNLHTNAAPTLRGRASYDLTKHIALRVGAALNYQPATFILPLPGFSDVALDRGLQRSIQSEAGFVLTLPEAFAIELTGFLNHYSDMLFPELFIEKTLSCEGGGDGCEDFSGSIPRADGLAYGIELFARRALNETLSGWIAYTLGAATASTNAGLEFPTEADVRHNLNVVAQINWGAGFGSGLRLFVRSGKPETRVGVMGQRTRRLPGFFRIDAHVAYSWDTGWGNFRLALEWFNVTMSREALQYDCDTASFFASDDPNCRDSDVEFAPAIFFPSLSLRATF